MTTNTTLEEKGLNPEPRNLPGIASEIITAILAGVGLVVFVACSAGVAITSDGAQLLCAAGILVGALMLFRFTRDDLRWAAYIVEATFIRTQNITLRQEIKALEHKLDDAQRPIIHVHRGSNKVDPTEPDSSWLDARLLIQTSLNGKIPGRNKSMLTQQRQTDALAFLAKANIIKQVGKQYELTTDRAEAAKRLEELIRLSI